MALESEIEKSPSLKAGILRKGLASRNSGSGVGPMPGRFSTSMPFSEAKASTLRT